MSSGLMLEEKEDGSIHIEVDDYNVDSLGGRDFECHFTLDKENAELLKKAVLNHGGDFMGDVSFLGMAPPRMRGQGAPGDWLWSSSKVGSGSGIPAEADVGLSAPGSLM